MSANNQTKVYRITLNESEIVSALEALQYQNRTHGLDQAAKAVLIKFQKYSIEFEHGTKTPAYVATGVKRQSAVNLSSLGATPEELAVAALSREELDSVKMDQFDYDMSYGVTLPLHRFIGKSVQQVREEEVAQEIAVTYAVAAECTKDAEIADQLFTSL